MEVDSDIKGETGDMSETMFEAGIHMLVTPTAPLCSTRGRVGPLGPRGLLDNFLADASLERLGTGEGSVALLGIGGSKARSVTPAREESWLTTDSLLDPRKPPFS